MDDLGMGQVFRDISMMPRGLVLVTGPTGISMMPRGLVLVTGPTGSGKSTTLAAMMDYINDNKYEHVLTIEDPIEFVHESTEALRSALREDPDIILVGEMRDLETIRLALTAAETGHLVFGTLHTTSAAKTIDRVIDVFPAAEKSMVRSMLSESLRSCAVPRLSAT
jgi:twitching motility protein PilT